ncbi:MAG: hypothetical protein AAGD05_05010 [Bacteroidota bacterium]
MVQQLSNYVMLVIALLLVRPLSAQDFPAQGSGLWLAKDFDNSTIQLSETSQGLWTATIVQSDKSEFVDKVIFNAGKYLPEKQQLKGTLIKPDNGMKINTTISFEDEKTLKVVGRKLFVTKTFYWTRI